MSDISISNDTIQSIGLDSQLSGMESLKGAESETGSGVNEGGMDSMEQAVAGTEVRSRTEEYFGAGPDFNSTGTDGDIRHAMSSIIDSAMGSITDEIA
ncbi:MAG: hypothetical protein H0S80_02670 [Desulfovibrionaceae bacterium]|nr:hypothetical protein [Desulfovibrionaceae bacterium]